MRSLFYDRRMLLTVCLRLINSGLACGEYQYMLPLLISGWCSHPALSYFCFCPCWELYIFPLRNYVFLTLPRLLEPCALPKKLELVTLPIPICCEYHRLPFGIYYWITSFKCIQKPFSNFCESTLLFHFPCILNLPRARLKIIRAPRNCTINLILLTFFSTGTSGPGRIFSSLVDGFERRYIYKVLFR